MPGLENDAYAAPRDLVQHVAVKMILAGSLGGQGIRPAFRTESAAAAILRHPNIVAIHDVGVQTELKRTSFSNRCAGGRHWGHISIFDKCGSWRASLSYRWSGRRRKGCWCQCVGLTHSPDLRRADGDGGHGLKGELGHHRGSELSVVTGRRTGREGARDCRVAGHRVVSDCRAVPLRNLEVQPPRVKTVAQVRPRLTRLNRMGGWG